MNVSCMVEFIQSEPEPGEGETKDLIREVKITRGDCFLPTAGRRFARNDGVVGSRHCEERSYEVISYKYTKTKKMVQLSSAPFETKKMVRLRRNFVEGTLLKEPCRRDK